MSACVCIVFSGLGWLGKYSSKFMWVNFGCIRRTEIPQIIAIKNTWVFVLKHLTEAFTEYIDTIHLRWYQWNLNRFLFLGFFWIFKLKILDLRFMVLVLFWGLARVFNLRICWIWATLSPHFSQPFSKCSCTSGSYVGWAVLQPSYRVLFSSSMKASMTRWWQSLLRPMPRSALVIHGIVSSHLSTHGFRRQVSVYLFMFKFERVYRSKLSSFSSLPGSGNRWFHLENKLWKEDEESSYYCSSWMGEIITPKMSW